MKNLIPKLYIEINKLNFTFFVVEDNNQGDFKILYKLETPLIGLENEGISDLEKYLASNKIYLMLKKIKFT